MTDIDLYFRDLLLLLELVVGVEFVDSGLGEFLAALLFGCSVRLGQVFVTEALDHFILFAFLPWTLGDQYIFGNIETFPKLFPNMHNFFDLMVHPLLYLCHFLLPSLAFVLL